MARKAIDIGKVWNPVCCHGSKSGKLVSWLTCSTAKNETFLIQIGRDIFLGSYAHAYKSQGQRSVDHFEDEMTRDRSPGVQIVWQVDWVLVIAGLSCFIGHCFSCSIVVVY